MPIPGEKAIQMVRTAHTQATQLDIGVTAVVVDESGRLIALGRMDRARPITVDIAMNKAYTAASFQQPTNQLSNVAAQAWFQSLIVSSNGRIMAGGGALPIVEGGNVGPQQGQQPNDSRGELGKALFNYYRNSISKDPLGRVGAGTHAADRRNVISENLNRAPKGDINPNRMPVPDPEAMTRHIKRV